ncbi:MAG: RNA polymerase subunit sigma [Planctomycetes bacterium]|nr:RNA polymerase subunit sigma [Planctomycetota bacterium]
MTQALLGLCRGEAAAEDLAGLVYTDLRRLANALLRRERQGHTLQATALVHEAWLRLVDATAFRGNDAQDARQQFLGLAATVMRRILVEHARARLAIKRGGQRQREELGDVPDPGAPDAAELLDLDAAVHALAAQRPRAGKIAELRIYGGLSVAEAAEVAGVSLTVAKGEWAIAQALLARWLRDLPQNH